MPSLAGRVHNFRMIGIDDSLSGVRLSTGVRRCATLLLGLVLVAVQLCSTCGISAAAAAELDSPVADPCHQSAPPKEHSAPHSCDCSHDIPLVLKAVDPVAAPLLEEASPELQIPVPGGQYGLGTFAKWQTGPPGAVALPHFRPELEYRVLLI
ncbi:MAG: hypothetical protein VX663_01575 [Pseudomonadota bacterium]|nr:hypothetical protein [Pseudomonadota bacterium]